MLAVPCVRSINRDNVLTDLFEEADGGTTSRIDQKGIP